jgi:hypothetical protein
MKPKKHWDYNKKDWWVKKSQHNDPNQPDQYVPESTWKDAYVQQPIDINASYELLKRMSANLNRAEQKSMYEEWVTRHQYNEPVSLKEFDLEKYIEQKSKEPPQEPKDYYPNINYYDSN